MNNTRHDTIRWAAFLLLCVLVGCVIAMFVATRGDLLRPHRLVLYITVALVAGTLFWLLTDSTGELSATASGIRLTGGAGIGACFIVLASWLSGSRTSQSIVPVPHQIPRDVVISILTPDSIADVGEVRTVSDRRYIYIEFVPDHEIGRIRIESAKISPTGVTFPVSEYTVSLSGIVASVPPSASKE